MNTTKVKRSRNAGFKNRSASRPSGQGRRSNNSKKKATTSIDINQLVKRAKPSIQHKYISERTFDEMPLDVNLKANLHKKGYQTPSQIQDETLEP
ncbi:MAG: hypothetical protein RLO81_20170, partial [Fulvivirga sp.]